MRELSQIDVIDRLRTTDYRIDVVRLQERAHEDFFPLLGQVSWKAWTRDPRLEQAVTVSIVNLR